jgi:O-antigen ligase
LLWLSLLAGVSSAAVLIARSDQLIAPLALVLSLASLLALPMLPSRLLAALVAVTLIAGQPVLSMLGLGSEAAPLKAALLGLAIAAAAKIGYAGRPLALVWMALWLTAFTLSVIGPDTFNLGALGAANATLGFVSGWMWLFVACPSKDISWRLRLVESTPALCVALGIALDAAGVRQVAYIGEGGVFRLAGSLIPPQLAMLAIVGLVASVARAAHRDTRSHWLWLSINMLICFATVTRGAIAAAVVILLAHMWAALRRPDMARGRLVAIATLLLGLATVSTAILLRSQGSSYEGAYNTSGRDAAWDFYIGVASLHPWAGNGVGAASVANTVDRPFGVQAAFESPHNEYIHLWLDVGAPLAAALCIVITALLYNGLRRSISPVSSMGITAGFLIFAFVDNPLSTVQFTAPLAIVLGALHSRTFSSEGSNAIAQN